MASEQQSVGRALMTAAAVVVLLGGMYLAQSFFGFVLLGIFFALLCYPIKHWLVGKGLSPAIALTLITLALAAIVVGLALLVGVSIGQIAANLPEYTDQITQQSQELTDQLADLGVAVSPDPLTQLFAAIIAAIASFLASSFYVLLLIVFLLIEGPDMFARTRRALGPDNPLIVRLQSFSSTMVHYFGIRTYLNALTGIGVAIALWLLGIDYAALWGVLLFFLSFVPYIGIFIASIPPTFLALAEYGPARALLVVVGIAVINLGLENIVLPRLVGKGLSMSAAVVFLSFFIWKGLLGTSGALLSIFLTVLVLLVLDSYDQTRWLVQILTPEPRAEKAPSSGAAVSDARAPGKQ